MPFLHLKDLNARIKNGILVFDCPGHCIGRIRVPILPNRNDKGEGWTAIGEFPNFTLIPSVNAEPCCHVNIKDGFLTPG